MAGGRSFIGTSGWVYDHWRGVFYPPELEQSRWLSFYMESFDTVEINNTFYHLPTPDAFRSWHEAAPRGFVYALKASRYITHMKKLKDPAGPLGLFMERASLLGQNLGPILFQLPPRWRCNPGRLEEFTGHLIKGHRRYAFEFRDPSWFCSEVYGILRAAGAALCLYHMPGFTTPVEVTASFVYIRFHGSGTLYGGRYPEKELRKWANTVRGFLEKGIDVYAYFNNDALGNAVLNARELREMVSG